MYHITESNNTDNIETPNQNSKNQNSKNQNYNDNIDLIPCEECGEFIQFNQFQKHLNTRCDRDDTSPSRLFNIIQDIQDINNNFREMNNNMNRTIQNSINRYIPNDNRVNLNILPEISNSSIINNNNNNNQSENNETDDDNDSTNSSSSVDSVITGGYFEGRSHVMPSIIHSHGDHQYENILQELMDNSRHRLQRNSIVNEFISNSNSNNITNTPIEPIEPIFTRSSFSGFNNLVDLLPRNHYDDSNNTYQYLRDLTSRIGDVKIGVKDINKIGKTITYDSDKLVECIICRFEKSEFLKLNECDHSYCSECSQSWFKENKKCPVCSHEYE
jgi:hypothetical protein